MTEKVFIKGMPLETIRKSLINNEKKPNYQRCSKCVMDSSINNLNFDDNGICEYCKNVKLSEPIFIRITNYFVVSVIAMPFKHIYK